MTLALTSLNSRLADAAIEAVSVISHSGAKYTVALQRAACDQSTTEYMWVTCLFTRIK